MIPSSTTPDSAREPSTRSPFAGCAIFIVAFAVMVFLIGFSLLTLFRQFNEIAKFTDVKPAPVAVTALAGKENDLSQLTARLVKFQQDLSAKEEAILALTADDLNLAISGYDAFKELRHTLHVAEIRGETLRLDISFPLNGKPRLTRSGEPGWTASDARYLNGTLVARPNLLKREFILGLDTIEVPGKTVAPGFIDQMSPYRITERYLGDKLIGPAMAQLTCVRIAQDKLLLIRTPGEIPTDFISNEQVDSGSRRLFTAIGIAAIGFLAFAALIIFIGLRSKARRS